LTSTFNAIVVDLTFILLVIFALPLISCCSRVLSIDLTKPWTIRRMEINCSHELLAQKEEKEEKEHFYYYLELHHDDLIV